MKKQQGSVHVAVVGVLVAALLGALGFIFWQNFMHKDAVVTNTKPVEKHHTDTPNDVGYLAIKPFGKFVDLKGVKYDDINYTMTSVNKDDENKFVAAIYSKDLNDRLVEDAKKADPSLDFNVLYVRYSANRAVYVYFYEEETNSPMPSMIEGVASNIIDPGLKTASTKLYVGFMGPGSYSTQELSNEMVAFKDFVKSNIK